MIIFGVLFTWFIGTSDVEVKFYIETPYTDSTELLCVRERYCPNQY
jgi:hypothetical protein